MTPMLIGVSEVFSCTCDAKKFFQNAAQEMHFLKISHPKFQSTWESVGSDVICESLVAPLTFFECLACLRTKISSGDRCEVSADVVTPSVATCIWCQIRSDFVERSLGVYTFSLLHVQQEPCINRALLSSC